VKGTLCIWGEGNLRERNI